MDLWVILRAGAAMLAGGEVIEAPQLAPMLLVREAGDRVLLQTPPSVPACYAQVFDGPLDLQVWVARRDLHLVLNAREERHFQDGSSVLLDPGLVVEDGAVQVGGLRVGVRHVGLSYGPELHAATPVNREPPPLWAPTTARLGDGLTRPLDPLDAWSGPFADVKVSGGRATLIEEAPCAQLRWAADWPPEPTDGAVLHGRSGLDGIGGLIATRGTPSFAYLPAGTPVYWADGSPAGEVRQDLAVRVEEQGKEAICFAQGLGDRQLRACARKADLRFRATGVGSL